MILNLGCGGKLIANAVNVDVMKFHGVDQVVDLSVFPWPWEDGSIEGIYASHIMEHFFDQKQFISECLRILQKDGCLYIAGPHASSIPSVGCLGHYRTYSYSTFDDYLAKPWYMFKEPKFKTEYQSLNWWYEKTGDNVPRWMMLFINPLNYIFNFLASLSPRICENLWCFYVGGFREVQWLGKKL